MTRGATWAHGGPPKPPQKRSHCTPGSNPKDFQSAPTAASEAPCESESVPTALPEPSGSAGKLPLHSQTLPERPTEDFLTEALKAAFEPVNELKHPGVRLRTSLMGHLFRLERQRAKHHTTK